MIKAYGVVRQPHKLGTSQEMHSRPNGANCNLETLESSRTLLERSLHGLLSRGPHESSLGPTHTIFESIFAVNHILYSHATNITSLIPRGPHCKAASSQT
jgi:hypothetical protein